MVLNIAEGAGEFSHREKARFYRMALRSTTESAAAIDIGLKVGAISETSRHSSGEILSEVIAMLTRLIQAVEKGPSKQVASPILREPFGSPEPWI